MVKKELQVIPYDSVIKIEIGGGFYARLQQLFLDFISNRSKEEIEDLIENLKKGEDNKDPFAYHFETLFIMIRSIEESAKSQNLVILKEIDFPDDENQNRE